MRTIAKASIAKPALIRNTFIFWMLLLAMAFGQERRDPTQPSAAIQQKFEVADRQTESPLPKIKVKAVVLRDPDHGTALIEAADRTFRIKLDRQHATEFTVEQITFIVKQFDSTSLLIEKKSKE